MTIILDLIGAAILVGILMISVFGMTENMQQTSYEKVFQLNAQTNVLALARIIESDFVKIGYHISDSVSAIISADSTSISFIADLRNQNVIDTVSYYISSTTQSVVSASKNPRDRILYRSHNGTSTISANLGLTSFKLQYFDTSGVATTVPSLIHSIQVNLRLESPERVIKPKESLADTTYPSVYWNKRIYPRNL